MAAVAVVLFVPGNRKVDPLACLACGYVYAVFIFQNVYIEWPAVPWPVLFLLAAALVALLAPTALNQPQVNLWEGSPLRVVCWFADVGIFIAGYRCMVRGPAPAGVQKGSLTDKVFVITGCNTGIGYETARLLALAGATVVFACRSVDRARAAMKAIVHGGHVDARQLIYLPLDTSNFASVRKFSALLEDSGLRPHTLIMNAGVMLSSRKLSVDGLEMTMATNHFGHFLLTKKLLPSLLAAEARGEHPRIVVVGSNMSYLHGEFDFSELEVAPTGEEVKRKVLQKPYELFRAYGQSKLANLHFTTELARRLRARGSSIPVNQVHPGEVLTEVMRDMHWAVVRLSALFRPVAMTFMKTPMQGCFCTMHVATDPGLETADKASGRHFVRCSPAPLSAAGSDELAAARLWRVSEEVTGEG